MEQGSSIDPGKLIALRHTENPLRSPTVFPDGNIPSAALRLFNVLQRPFGIPFASMSGATNASPGEAMAGRTLRVLVVDDNESIRRSISQILRSQPDIEIVCEAIDGADALQRIREHQPDVVLLDITMPRMNGLEVAETIKTEFPSVQVLIVSQHDSRGFQWAALAAGVSGYIIKSNVGRDLVPELRRIQGLPPLA